MVGFGLVIMLFIWLMGMTIGTVWLQYGHTLEGIIVIVIAWVFVIIPFVPNVVEFYKSRKSINISK